MELCCFSGQHSDKWKDDSELIQKITNDIWHKLSSARFGELVGMDLRMRRMYELLSIESKADQVRVIGIWGREGLGKRTLARCLYRETSHTFDVHVSLGYISRFHQENNSFLLRQKLRSELIQASGGIHMISGDDDTAWLADRRVLLVVEGVETAEQLCIIMEEAKLFGPGSRVIVICEDQHLLLASGITLLYQVEPLEFYEALELLRLRAVNHTDPLSGYKHLLTRAAKIGNGYPRTVASIGSELFGKPKEEWETVISKYEKLSDEGTIGEEIRDFSVPDDEDRSLSRNLELNYVGMDCHLQAVCGLMELESGNEVRFVGIWGAGGIGKTTLARCVYEETMQYFHTHIFLENVGKIYQDHGPSGLQEELLWKNIQREALAARSSKNGSDVAKARLRNRRVLLVVDGVDGNEQIKDVQKVATGFGVGSRVIMTTRDDNLLVGNGIKHLYEVKCLRVHEALQLFYYFAFTEKPPFTRFKQLSVRAVQLAGRIPLSLQILGSLLRGKSGHEWESVLQKLERHQDRNKAEVGSIDMVVSSVGKPDDDNVNMLDGSDVTASEVVTRLPEENHIVARESKSVYERDCIPLWATVSICGERSEMEDAVTASPHFLKIPIKMLHEEMSPSLTCVPCHFFGVYDGHGGSQYALFATLYCSHFRWVFLQVAEYCRERIHFALAEEIERIKEELCKRNTDEDRQVLWEKVFTSCFLKVDDEVRGKISSLGVGSSDRVLEAFALQTAGSTAVVALVCSSHIIVSNCGDSRAVLFRGKECMPLSVDHKPDREDEYARIERAGGKVIQWHGARVSGFLALSRSIGDEYLKPYVIPDPEVTFMPRAKEDDCLILASDGLWDVMSNQEACKFARKRILIWHKKNEAMSLDERGVGEDHACQSAADYLSKLALRKGSKDNVSIIVIDLKPKRKFKERP
ncbi:hypothetical protein Bca52824_078837 [Brassica carinata]|uniref:protein-serine/threonine phosphatase n=1 Tax=Brassica carinata TaxID=52824 RepID=A0A8X7PYE2_BRACI|nr:hypothetical protein Bca52824_078837 [Brassica carinata]